MSERVSPRACKSLRLHVQTFGHQAHCSSSVHQKCALVCISVPSSERFGALLHPLCMNRGNQLPAVIVPNSSVTK